MYMQRTWRGKKEKKEKEKYKQNRIKLIKI